MNKNNTKNDKIEQDTTLEVVYFPEHTDLIECPACKTEVNALKCIDNERCTNCGQKLKISVSLS